MKDLSTDYGQGSGVEVEMTELWNKCIKYSYVHLNLGIVGTDIFGVKVKMSQQRF